MQIQHSIEREGDSSGRHLIEGDIRVVIAYNDIVAGTRAMGVLDKLAKRIGTDVDFHPIPWSFNLLDDLDWQAVAASDAIKADILILAVNSGATMPSSVKRWTKNVIEQKKGTTAAVVALLDPEGNTDLETIKHWVKKAGLSFFAPAPCAELEKTVAHLDERADRITNVLEHILEDHDAGPSPRLNP